MDWEPNLGMRCPRGRGRTATADARADDCQSADEERRPDHQVRPAGRPSQERPGEHVPNQLHAGELTLRPEFVLKVQQLVAISVANPSRIELEQRARQAGAHALWTPIRVSPTRAIIASRVSCSVSASVPSAVIW